MINGKWNGGVAKVTDWERVKYFCVKLVLLFIIFLCAYLAWEDINDEGNPKILWL